MIEIKIEFQKLSDGKVQSMVLHPDGTAYHSPRLQSYQEALDMATCYLSFAGEFWEAQLEEKREEAADATV